MSVQDMTLVLTGTRYFFWDIRVLVGDTSITIGSPFFGAELLGTVTHFFFLAL